MKTGALVVGSAIDCRQFLQSITGYYVYILRRPDGRPFYVGKGFRFRALEHENEARHPNDRRSNAYKLNIIRAINRSGRTMVYEIDFVSDDQAAVYARETTLIATFKRLHEGGPLTNLAPGGGSTAGIAPASRERHSTTLSGMPDDNPERATLNGFVLSIADMRSVVLKPLGQFLPRPSQRYPQKSMKPSVRQAVALAASAAANGISMETACKIPRTVDVQSVRGFIENGVSCDILTSGMATVVLANDPADEIFELTASQARGVVGLIGHRKCIDLGILQGEMTS